MDLFLNEFLEVRDLPKKGRSIFTRIDIAAGELIERVPVLVFPEDQMETIEKTALGPYYYNWNDKGAIALGLASLYNHSATPNLEFEKHYNDNVISFFASRDIAAGEELTINYLDPSEKHPLWFDPE